MQSFGHQETHWTQETWQRQDTRWPFPSGFDESKSVEVERLEDVKSLRWMVKGGEMAGGSKVSLFGWGGNFLGRHS